MVELTFLFKDPPLSVFGYNFGPTLVIQHATSLMRH
jgi:hypothetical protein